MNQIGDYSPLNHLLDQVRLVLPKDIPVYLVGGAVRDALLGLPSNDLDFVMPKGKVIKTSRRIANELGASFYPLDAKRGTARIIMMQPDNRRLILDFAAFRAQDLENDLRARDFTINAIAIDTRNPKIIIDPTGGAADLRAGLLRACSESAMLSDPLRILRGVRLSIQFGLKILPHTLQLIKQAVPHLPEISAERVRDELFHILQSPQTATAVRVLDILGALPLLLPELTSLKDLTQSPPHIYSAWEHTLATVKKLDQLLNALAPKHNPEKAANWTLGLVSVQLGRYRGQIQDRLAISPTPDRNLAALLRLATLYHDSGKPQTRRLESNGKIRFIDHENTGASLLAARARRLHLSNIEITYIKTVVQNHMRPLWLAQSGLALSRRAIYRYFRDCGDAGIDICLLALADTLGTYGASLPTAVWIKLLDTVRSLFEARWEQPEEQISPPALLTGHDLIKTFALKPGPVIGQLLEALRESQAAGDIQKYDQAMEFAKNWLVENK